jgi:hypothetical protein
MENSTPQDEIEITFQNAKDGVTGLRVHITREQNDAGRNTYPTQITLLVQRSQDHVLDVTALTAIVRAKMGEMADNATVRQEGQYSLIEFPPARKTSAGPSPFIRRLFRAGIIAWTEGSDAVRKIEVKQESFRRAADARL